MAFLATAKPWNAQRKLPSRPQVSRRRQTAEPTSCRPGSGTRFANALRLNVYPKKGTSLRAAALIWHKIPYAGVFEEGATIRGRPTLWLPLPSTPQKYGRYRLTPERYTKEIGPLQYVKRPGKSPLLFAKVKSTKSGKPGKPSLSRLKAGARGAGQDHLGPGLRRHRQCVDPQAPRHHRHRSQSP